MENVKKSDEIVAEVAELVKSVVGKLNSLDSKAERANACSAVLTDIIAGTELSKIEKVGILFSLTTSRVKA